LLVTKSAIRPGSNFNRQGGSIFHQRQHPWELEPSQEAHRGGPHVDANVVVDNFYRSSVSKGPDFPFEGHAVAAECREVVGRLELRKVLPDIITDVCSQLFA
ncbi:hypothetical protein, partial [Ectopseudomonas oleovorans]|uniref:hypothetical protein n=1 Tax=Ectopseudomonas oleovorans TaxID=301 RepID=UPI0019D2EE08